MRQTEVRPAHFREVPEQIILVQVKPVFAGDGVAYGVTGVRVQHHFGITDGARCEIDQAGVIATGFGSCKFR